MTELTEASSWLILFRSAETREWERLPGEFLKPDATFRAAKLKAEGQALDTMVVTRAEWDTWGLDIEKYTFRQGF